MKKILIIANYEKSNGGISGQVDILLDKFKYDADLFNTKTNNLLRIFLPLKLFFRGVNFDVFHIHGCSSFGFYPIIIGTVVGRLLKKKTIVTYHGGGLDLFLKKYPRMVSFFLRKADILTVPSVFLLEILQSNNIPVIHLPNIIREDNVQFKKRDDIFPNLIVTRSLERIYNIPLVIRAFVKIKKNYSEAKLYIVGDGSLADNLKYEVNNLGVDGIKFLGRVPNSEIGRVLNKADIYINPTTVDNMPLSLFEAFACGLPAISTNVGGIPDYINNNINGFLIPNNDEDALVEKIEYILSNNKKMNSIINNAYLTFKNYTWRSLKNSYYGLYYE